MASVPSGISTQEFETLRSDLERELIELKRQAEAKFGREMPDAADVSVLPEGALDAH